MSNPIEPIESYIEWVKDWLIQMENDYGVKKTSFSKIKYV
jgi:hypothetical protein